MPITHWSRWACILTVAMTAMVLYAAEPALPTGTPRLTVGVLLITASIEVLEAGSPAPPQVFLTAVNRGDFDMDETVTIEMVGTRHISSVPGSSFADLPVVLGKKPVRFEVAAHQKTEIRLEVPLDKPKPPKGIFAFVGLRASLYVVSGSNRVAFGNLTREDKPPQTVGGQPIRVWTYKVLLNGAPGYVYHPANEWSNAIFIHGDVLRRGRSINKAIYNND